MVKQVSLHPSEDWDSGVWMEEAGLAPALKHSTFQHRGPYVWGPPSLPPSSCWLPQTLSIIPVPSKDTKTVSLESIHMDVTILFSCGISFLQLP